MNTAALKGIDAGLAGILINVVLTVATDVTLLTLKIFPPFRTGLFVIWMVGLALLYRIVYSALGGYVTVWLAPSTPRWHVKWLMGAGFAIGIASTLGGVEMFPHW